MTAELNKDKSDMPQHYNAPDGGWGWWVVAGTALINIFNQSLVSVFGILVGFKVETISGSKYVGTIMSLNSCLTNFSGIMIGPLMKILSTRTIAQIGIISVSLGLLLSGLASSYHLIALGYGVFTGLGLGVISASTFLMINSYFLTRKSMAVGLAMAGTSVGQIIMPLFIAYCRQLVGVDITIFILSGCSFCGILGTFCFYPVEEVVEHSELLNKFVPNILYNKNSGNEKKNETYVDGEALEKANDYNVAKDLKNIPTKEKPKKNFMWYWNEIIKGNDFSVLKDWRFVFILFGLSLTFVTNTSFSTFFPLYLADDVLLSEMQVSTCLSVLSTMDLLGRLTIPFIAKHLNLTPRWTFIVGLLAISIFRSYIAIESDFTTIVILSAVTGFSRSAPVVNQNIIAVDSCPREKVSSALGMFMIFKGFFILICGSILGYFKYYFGNYSILIHSIDGLSAAVIVAWFMEIIYSKCIKNN